MRAVSTRPAIGLRTMSRSSRAWPLLSAAATEPPWLSDWKTLPAEASWRARLVCLP